MTTIWARQALTPQGWQSDVTVEIDAKGRISGVTQGTEQGAGTITDILLPAPANVHSHAFQRAMAGLTETRGPDPRDSFWTWRQRMYRFLTHLTPDQNRAIAAFVQMEMLEAGYGASVEFHYLHHAPDGAPYDDLAEMSHQIIEAARQSGIGLTLLPVLYQYGGLDRRKLGPGQIRFGNDFQRFALLTAKVRRLVGDLPEDARFGVAPHSLRAVDPTSLHDVAKLAQGGPVHMHLAEQQQEVDEVLSALGARPVEWMLQNTDLSGNWCLIHCTQMLATETRELAKTGAIAGLCPITEASLGDGIFDATGFLEAGGAIAVGSDSNIRISLTEELRTLEYTQRLRDHTRAALATPLKSTGRRIFDEVCAGGAQAAGRDSGRITPGAWADLVALDSALTNLMDLAGDTVLDALIFASGNGMVRDVWSAGRHVVTQGRHKDRAAIDESYRRAVAQLKDVM